MGAGLVQRALLEPIDKDAKLVLVAMSLMALDTPRNGRPAGIYFGGHEYLMGVIRGEIPDHGTPEYQAARQAVKRCLMKLTAAGTIELTRPAARGRQAEYRITFTVDNPVDNVRDLPTMGYATRTPIGTPDVPQSG